MSEQLGRMRAMAEQLVALDQEIGLLERSLQDAKDRRQELEQADLPELMRELGFTSFAMADGSKVTLIDDISCAITDANRVAALRWLDANGFGGLIKTQMQVDFNREDRELAVAMAHDIEQRAQRSGGSITPTINERVHPGTLKSFLKEELGKGTAVPFDLFSVFPFSKVKIVLGGGKRR